MLRLKFIKGWVHGGILIAGALIMFTASSRLATHGQRLWLHIRSGSWEVFTDKPLIESHIRSRYLDLIDRWSISFIGGGGSSFPLDREYIAATIGNIGHRTVAQSSGLQFNATPVQIAYGHLLSQIIYNIDPPAEDAQAISALKELALAIQRKLKNPANIVEKSSLERVKGILGKLPNQNVIKDAISVFEEFSTSRGLGFPAFQVGTDPPYDSPDTWDAKAVILPQSERCLGTAEANGTSSEFIPVDISSFPRLIEIELDRPWLSDALMNNAAVSSNRSIANHFAFGGDLSIIPWRLWIVLSDQLEFAATSKSQNTILKSWASDNICCKVVCGAKTFQVRADKLALKLDRWKSLKDDTPPSLFAIVSRSRIYK